MTGGGDGSGNGATPNGAAAGSAPRHVQGRRRPGGGLNFAGGDGGAFRFGLGGGGAFPGANGPRPHNSRFGVNGGGGGGHSGVLGASCSGDGEGLVLCRLDRDLGRLQVRHHADSLELLARCKFDLVGEEAVVGLARSGGSR